MKPPTSSLDDDVKKLLKKTEKYKGKNNGGKDESRKDGLADLEGKNGGES